MTPLEYLKDIRRTLPEISRESGCSTFFLARTFAWRYLTRRMWLGEFRSLKLYRCSGPRFREYLLYYESERISDRLNAGASQEQLDAFLKKDRFNAVFRPFVRRDWLYLPDCGQAEAAALLEKHGAAFLKDCEGSRGNGILRLAAGADMSAVWEEYGGRPFLMEAPIRQHPAMAAVNPGSVNTIRLIAARHGDSVQPIGAGLRTGGGGQVVDNFHHGGTAYPLDLDAGIVTGPGIDLEGNAVLRHPVTGHIMPGFQVPMWDRVLDTVRRAAVTVPNVGYVGWDIAVTEEGPELIEGNINYPGNTIIQLDGPGPRKRLLDFCAREGV